MTALEQARAIVHPLGLSGRAFDRDLLLERLESRRGVSITAVADTRLPTGGISGARITTNGRHVVFYPGGASERMQLAVICHECAHILLDHPSLAVDDVLNGSELLSADHELEAEAMGAALVQLSQQPERLRSVVQGGGPVAAVSALAEFRSNFGEYYGRPA